MKNEIYGRIYKAEFPNGKLYVGATTRTLVKRANSHIYAAKRGSGCPAFSNAVRKHGMPKFSELCVVFSREELDTAEVKWIESLDTMVPKGYNIKEGGSNGRHSEETKRKISLNHTGERHPSFGVKWNEGRILSFKKSQAGEGNRFYGKHHTDSSKDKIASKKRKLSDDDVIEIRELYDRGDITQKIIAESYGVSQTVIHRAINGTRRCYAKLGDSFNA